MIFLRIVQAEKEKKHTPIQTTPQKLHYLKTVLHMCFLCYKLLFFLRKEHIYFHFPYPPLAVELHCWWFEQISVAENVTGWSPVSDHRKSLLKNLFWSLTVDQENNDFRGVFLHQHYFKPEIWVFRTVCAGTPTPSTSGPPVLPRGRHEVRKVVTWVTGHHQEYLDFLESLLLDVKFWERAPRLVIWKMVMFIAEKRIVFPGWM